jgi:hypothetical protein
MRNGLLLLVLAGSVATLSAQAPRAAFEVASVKKLTERIEQPSFDLLTPSTAFFFRTRPSPH